jgi:hypothetical protein
MSGTTYFVQECPTCGRALQVRVEYLGKKVSCQHCAARFVASDGSMDELSVLDSGISLLERAEQLIDSATKITSESRKSKLAGGSV